MYFDGMPATATQLNTYFGAGYVAARNDGNDLRVQLSLGRYAIAINLEDVRGGPTTDVHPGMNALNPDNINPNDDPTLRAVVLGYWAGEEGCGAVCSWFVVHIWNGLYRGKNLLRYFTTATNKMTRSSIRLNENSDMGISSRVVNC